MIDQDKMQVDVGEPVAWRWPYRFRDIGETGAYEHHSHVFAVLNNMPHGEPLFTADQLAAAVQQERDRCAKVCESMHDEDKPGDYAYAIRSGK